MTKKMDSSSEKMITIENLDYPRPVQIPPMEEIDGVDGLLRRIHDHTSDLSASRFAYQDLEEHDYISEEALHRVVEDLQFGHDLRL